MKTTTETASFAPGSTVHVFERSGLGKAPYTFQYAARVKGSCDLCGTGIAIGYFVRSADDRIFKLGCDCIYKSGDAGLRLVVSAAEKNMERERVEARAAALKEQATAALAREEVRAALAAQPDPNGREGGTLLSYVEWCMRNAGRTGMMKVARIVLRAAEVH